MKLSKSDAGYMGYLAAAEKIKDAAINRQKEYNKSPLECPECNNPLSYKDKTMSKRFCSQSCAAKFNNKRKGYPIPKRSRKQFFDDRRIAVDQKIEQGLVRFRATLKGYLFRVTHQGKWFCDQCKLDKWNNLPIPIELDHKDGNATNNLPNNLRLLCPNCHAQTPTAKGKNKGYGRKTLGIREGY